MRVLHVINSLAGSGGAEHGLVREVVRFSDSVQQTVVRLFDGDHLDDAVESSGIEVVRLGFASGSASINWPLAAARLAGVSRSFSPDVIHTSLFSGNLVGQLAARRVRAPVVSTFTLSGDQALLRQHQPGAHTWRAGWLRSLAGWSARTSGAAFRALTTDALATNCALLRVAESRATVIPRGVPDDLRPDELKSRDRLGLPSEGPLLVNVGRQTSQKGHGFLLSVLENLRMHDHWHLAIVGREGDATASLRQEVSAASLDDHVSLTGYTPEVHHYMANADVFAFPSYMEGLGTAVLEAMVLGIPVVAFDIPPVREVTQEGRHAILVPVGDVDSFTSAVLEARTQVDIEAAREWVLGRYSLASVAARVEAFLGEVASA